MSIKSKILPALAGISLCLNLNVAQAAITMVSEADFSATATETFEGFAADSFHTSESVLGGSGTMTGHGAAAPGEWFVAQLGRWGLNSTDLGWTNVLPSDGNQFATLYGEGYVDIAFGGGVFGFGGYFADIALDRDTSFDFFDASDASLGSFTLDFQSAAGEMSWAGFMSDDAIGRVRISGFETAMDSLQISGATEGVPSASPLALIGLGLLGLSLLRRRIA